MRLERRALLFTFLMPVFFAPGQEPAFVHGKQAMRFEEAAGVFHYMIPCGSVRPSEPWGATRSSGPIMEPALCWPVRMIQVRDAKGGAMSSPQFDAMLRISGSQVQVLPTLRENIAYRTIAPLAETVLEHVPGTVYASLSTREAGFRFSFSNLCLTCKEGSPVTMDAGRATQREQEYAFLRNALSHFEPANKQVLALSSNVRVTVRPSNQPQPGRDPPEAMGLYAKLNQVLSESCSGAAQACVRGYQVYQSCMAAAKQGCAAPPSCTASCTVKPEVPPQAKATLCVAGEDDGATLLPDWTEVLPAIDADRRKDPSGRPWERGVNTNPDVCGPLNRWGAAQLAYNRRKAGITNDSQIEGVAGISGMSGSLAPTRSEIVRPPPPGSHSIAEVAFQENIVDRAAPKYPALAKAAHISGTVVLHAIISPKGEVESLTVISGPEMLRASALDAVAHWTYKPYLLEGKPVEVDTTITVNYALGDKAGP